VSSPLEKGFNPCLLHSNRRRKEPCYSLWYLHYEISPIQMCVPYMWRHVGHTGISVEYLPPLLCPFSNASEQKKWYNNSNIKAYRHSSNSHFPHIHQISLTPPFLIPSSFENPPKLQILITSSRCQNLSIGTQRRM
jgi:hypothetical protein